MLVGDFGLARDVYFADYYKSSASKKLPVKWMAPETLNDGISNEKTDVVSSYTYTVYMCTMSIRVCNKGLYPTYIYSYSMVYTSPMRIYIQAGLITVNLNNRNNSFCLIFCSSQWSYGVTCWEVFSLGRSPYPGIENHEILQHISSGGRLKKPSLCPDQL